MRRILLEVAYDGTDYVGWQVQPNGVSIESVLNRELSKFFKEEIKVIGASRTDSGVHAHSAMCVFDTHARMRADKVSYALNAFLPKDIVIQKSMEVDPSFHPRYEQSEKTYVYRILNRRMRDPMLRRNTYFYCRDLDVQRMQEAAQKLLGEHDFISFASPHFTAKTTVRTLYECRVDRSGDLIEITVRGNGFLYNMVRIIAGTLIEVGNGRFNPADMDRILEAKDREAAGPTAPAHGLTLERTKYLNLSQKSVDTAE